MVTGIGEGDGTGNDKLFRIFCEENNKPNTVYYWAENAQQIRENFSRWEPEYTIVKIKRVGSGE